jgi:hypothetical protein
MGGGWFSRVRASLTAESGRRRRKPFAFPGLEGGAVGFEGARYVRLGCAGGDVPRLMLPWR